MENDALQVLRTAYAVGASPGGFALGAQQRHRAISIVDGAKSRPLYGLFSAVAQLFQGFYNIRNYISGSLDEHLITQPQVLLANEIFVVQRDGTDFDTRQGHGFYLCYRRNRACLTYLVFYTQ